MRVNFPFFFVVVMVCDHLYFSYMYYSLVCQPGSTIKLTEIILRIITIFKLGSS